MALSAFTAARAEPDLLSSLGQLEEAFKSGDQVVTKAVLVAAGAEKKGKVGEAWTRKVAVAFGGALRACSACARAAEDAALVAAARPVSPSFALGLWTMTDELDNQFHYRWTCEDGEVKGHQMSSAEAGADAMFNAVGTIEWKNDLNGGAGAYKIAWKCICGMWGDAICEGVLELDDDGQPFKLVDGDYESHDGGGIKNGGGAFTGVKTA